MIIDAWSLYEEMQNKDKCKICDRKITDSIKTKKGCVWCDYDYWKNK